MGQQIVQYLNQNAVLLAVQVPKMRDRNYSAGAGGGGFQVAIAGVHPEAACCLRAALLLGYCRERSETQNCDQERAYSARSSSKCAGFGACAFGERNNTTTLHCAAADAVLQSQC